MRSTSGQVGVRMMSSYSARADRERTRRYREYCCCCYYHYYYSMYSTDVGIKYGVDRPGSRDDDDDET